MKMNPLTLNLKLTLSNCHKKSFTRENYKNNTELSKEYWKIKSQNGIHEITWKIILNVQPSTKTMRAMFKRKNRDHVL